MSPVLVEAWRGDAVESEHSGSVAVADADGALVVALGDIDRPVFPRSAVKALQALPLVESDAADRLGLTDDELAIACASHNGEPAHVRTAAGMLAKAGVDAGVLECGAHWPYSDAALRELAARGDKPTALNIEIPRHMFLGEAHLIIGRDHEGEAERTSDRRGT